MASAIALRFKETANARRAPLLPITSAQLAMTLWSLSGHIPSLLKIQEGFVWYPSFVTKEALIITSSIYPHYLIAFYTKGDDSLAFINGLLETDRIHVLQYARVCQHFLQRFQGNSSTSGDWAREFASLDMALASYERDRYTVINKMRRSLLQMLVSLWGVTECSEGFREEDALLTSILHEWFYPVHAGALCSSYIAFDKDLETKYSWTLSPDDMSGRHLDCTSFAKTVFDDVRVAFECSPPNLQPPPSTRSVDS